ncbi:MAG: helix-turn-helix domain-containing protein [Chloroflexi bacterium]|nr:helix-turn-helix domain-containing protein [Chloroflexota bacterium]
MGRGAIVISTIGSTLKERGISLNELHKRLVRRGLNISRGAIERLASDRPIKSVNFDLLLPILDELDLPLGPPFAAVDPEVAERRRAERQQVESRAREVARSLTQGRVTSPSAAEGLRALEEDERTRALAEADADDQALIARLQERLRREHPEIFDRRGRLRTRDLTRTLVQEFGTTRLSKGDVLSVIRRGRSARTRATG